MTRDIHLLLDLQSLFMTVQRSPVMKNPSVGVVLTRYYADIDEHRTWLKEGLAGAKTDPIAS